MLAELFIAALAFYFWLALEPGLARALAYNVAVLGSVTTLFFNANPLLRYDGYYILADLIEIPNLGARANQLLAVPGRALCSSACATRAAAGHAAASGAGSSATRRWPIVYRLFVTLGIAWFVAQQYLLRRRAARGSGRWSTSVVWPIWQGAARRCSPRRSFAGRGARMRRACSARGALPSRWLLFVVPLPYHTRAEGVVWLPERAILRAGADGFVARVLRAAGPDGRRRRAGAARAVDPGAAPRASRRRRRASTRRRRGSTRPGALRRPQRSSSSRSWRARRAALARLHDEADAADAAQPRSTARC